jgi:hypothetical protein
VPARDHLPRPEDAHIAVRQPKEGTQSQADEAHNALPRRLVAIDFPNKIHRL